MHIERHVFGSYKGYTTLARSPGVSIEDCRLLERCAFSIGQTYDSKFYKSLGKDPAFFTQQLPGHRRALTRITEGEKDSAGRSTLCCISVILSESDWNTVLMGDIGALMDSREAWKWDGSGDISALELAIRGDLSIPVRSRNKALLIISQIERCFVTHRQVVCSEADVDRDTVRAVEMMLPTAVRPRVTTGYRLLSTQCPTSLVVLAEQGAGAVSFHPNERFGYSPYAQAIKTGGIEGGTLPLQVISGYRDFGAPPRQQATSTHTVVVEKERPVNRWLVAAALLLGVLLGMVAMIPLRHWYMSSKGLVKHENRWLTPAEKDFSERLSANLIAPFQDGWATTQAVKRAEDRQILVGNKWMTEQEYLLAQARKNEGRLFNGRSWVAPEEYTANYLQSNGWQQVDNVWVKGSDLPQELIDKHMRSRSMVSYRGGWLPADVMMSLLSQIPATQDSSLLRDDPTQAAPADEGEAE